MSNNHVFNINHQTATAKAMAPGKRAGALNLPENGIIKAIIAQRDVNKTVLQLADGEHLNIRQGHVEGEVGEEVFFELNRTSDGGIALRQVFPESHQQNLAAHQISMKNLKELMIHKDYAQAPENPMDATALAADRAELARKVNEAVAKLSRSINRITANAQGAAVAQLAASGVNIDKISIPLLDNVTSQLEAAKAAKSPQLMDELHNKLNSVMDMSDDQIARALKSGADLTLDNLYIFKHSGTVETEAALTDKDWQHLQKDVAKFFEREGIEPKAENLARARFLLENDISLDIENFNRLIFLNDIEGNVDMDVLLDQALVLDYTGKGIGGLDVYKPEQMKMAETRLMMSYEANLPLIGTQLEIDLNPQIEALKELKARAGELLGALQEVNLDGENSRRTMLDTFKSIFTLPFANFDIFAQLIKSDGRLNPEDAKRFNLANLESLITSSAYEANATVASLKYGDVFAKVAEQFAPLLAELGLPGDDDSIRAAKILSMNNLDINAENLLAIKDVDAKLARVQSHLHPRMAARMIAEGMNPGAMNIDELLEHMARFDNDFGTNDNEKLARHIVEMDRAGEMDDALRQQVIEIYQMLHKISKNGGAGIGFAVNAGVELTLQSLMDFSKNFNLSGARRNTVNYTVEDGTYYAKHLVTSFISAARPRPLSKFVQNESLNDHLSASVAKLNDIADGMAEESEIEKELDVARINRAIEELSSSGRENIRFLTNLGLPVTLGNIRQLKTLKERKLAEDLSVLEQAELEEIAKGLQNSDLSEYAAGATAAGLNSQLLEQIEQISEQTMEAKKITELDILMQNLNFRNLMFGSMGGSDFSGPLNFNGRIADVAMFVVNDNISLNTGVVAYLNLKTAMGEVSGLVNMSEDGASVRIAAGPAATKFLQQNEGFLAEMLASTGLDNIDISFTDNNSIKKLLSAMANLPI